MLFWSQRMLTGRKRCLSSLGRLLGRRERRDSCSKRHRSMAQSNTTLAAGGCLVTLHGSEIFGRSPCSLCRERQLNKSSLRAYPQQHHQIDSRFVAPAWCIQLEADGVNRGLVVEPTQPVFLQGVLGLFAKNLDILLIWVF